jgi:hypothetical protein
MKINQVKNGKKFNEGFGTAIKNAVLGPSAEDKTQRNFTQSFINKITGSLDAAIRSGLVSPDASSTPTSGTTPSGTTPSGTTPSAPTSGTTPSAPTSGTTPSAPTSGTTPSGTTPSGTTPSGTTPSGTTPSAPTSGTTPTTLPAGSTNAVKKPAPNAAAGAVARNRAKAFNKATLPGYAGAVREDKFNHLNYIFENIMSVLDEQAAQESISDFVHNAALQYIGNMPGLEKYEANLKQVADKVQQTYSKDKGKAALISLGNMVFAIMQTARNAKGEFSNYQSQQQSQPQQAQSPVERQINQQLNAALAKMTPQEKIALIQALNKTSPT